MIAMEFIIKLCVFVFLALIGHGAEGKTGECGVFRCNVAVPQVNNGHFLASSGLQIATLQCDPGYDPVGQTTISCRPNLQWSTPDVICQGLSGTNFVTVFPQTLVQDGGNRRDLLITANGLTTVNITNALDGSSQQVVINGGFMQLPFPINLTLTEDDVITDQVLSISSDRPITVHTFVSTVTTPRQGQDSFLVRPTPQLCNEYIIMTTESTPQFNIIALEDDTLVSLDLTNGEDQQVTLNMNQVFTRTLSDDEDLTGSIITADKPIAVISGGSFAKVPAQLNFMDMNVDQLICPDDWGSLCVLGPYRPRSGFLFKVVAKEDGTVVDLTIDGVPMAPVNLNRGEFHLEYLLPTSDRTAVVQSNTPVLVGQFSLANAPGEGDRMGADSSMVLCVPPEDYLGLYRFSTLVPHRDTFLRIVIRPALQDQLRLNDAPLTVFDTVNVMVPGDGSYNILYVMLDEGEYYVLKTLNGGTFGAELYGVNGIGHTQYTHSLGRKAD